MSGCNTPCAPNTHPQELELFGEEKVVLQIAANVFSETPVLCWNSQKGPRRILSVPVRLVCTIYNLWDKTVIEKESLDTKHEQEPSAVRKLKSKE